MKSVTCSGGSRSATRLGDDMAAVASVRRIGGDFLPFFRAWIADPLRVASVMPSGAGLAALITSEVSAQTGPVLELGPGTGVFTRALIDRGVHQRDLTLIEFGADFAGLLSNRFPEARVVQADAARLRQHRLFDTPRVGAVVSGLPVLSMPARKVMSILAGAFSYLRPGGAFYQFTYGLRCPISRAILDRLGLKAVKLGSTRRNLPPATVYRITRRPSSRLMPLPA